MRVIICDQSVRQIIKLLSGDSVALNPAHETICG